MIYPRFGKALGLLGAAQGDAWAGEVVGNGKQKAPQVVDHLGALSVAAAVVRKPWGSFPFPGAYFILSGGAEKIKPLEN